MFSETSLRPICLYCTSLSFFISFYFFLFWCSKYVSQTENDIFPSVCVFFPSHQILCSLNTEHVKGVYFMTATNLWKAVTHHQSSCSMCRGCEIKVCFVVCSLGFMRPQEHTEVCKFLHCTGWKWFHWLCYQMKRSICLFHQVWQEAVSDSPSTSISHLSTKTASLVAVTENRLRALVRQIVRKGRAISPKMMSSVFLEVVT